MPCSSQIISEIPPEIHTVEKCYIIKSIDLIHSQIMLFSVSSYSFFFFLSDKMSSADGGASAGVFIGAGEGGAALVVGIIAGVVYCYYKARKEKSNTNMTKSSDHVFTTGNRTSTMVGVSIMLLKNDRRQCPSVGHFSA